MEAESSETRLTLVGEKKIKSEYPAGFTPWHYEGDVKHLFFETFNSKFQKVVWCRLCLAGPGHATPVIGKQTDKKSDLVTAWKIS